MTAKVGWLIWKDLACELRARRFWPTLLLLGIVLAALFALQTEPLPEQQTRAAASQLWLCALVAAAGILDRGFVAEQEDGCWPALLLYPITPTTVFLAKFAVNLLWLMVLQAVLLPLLAILYEVPLWPQLAPLLLVALLGNIGIAAMGTLIGAAVAGLRGGAGLPVLLILPLAIPILLIATEATRLTFAGDFLTSGWWYAALLGLFSLVFVIAGALLIDYVVEE